MSTEEGATNRNRSALTAFDERLRQMSRFPLVSETIDIFQMNVGKLCNLQCRHCHVQASPAHGELMSAETFSACASIIENHDFSTVDITGGAPEMNPNLEDFLSRIAGKGRRTIVRSNLVILQEKPYKKFIDLYVRNNIEICASLPDPRREKTDRQRGEGFFQRFMEVVLELNLRGYGREGSGLVLNLVHNPVGAYLPASQPVLESEFRRRIHDEQKAFFNHLFCITNMPIGRFLTYLEQSGNLADYWLTLESAFNPGTVETLMCRNTISVDWSGALFDCDFNQVLGLPVDHGVPAHVSRFELNSLEHRRIRTGDHCYGCTAGLGSSCQGELAISE